MMRACVLGMIAGLSLPWGAGAQEAHSGLDARAVVSVEGAASNVLTAAPRFGDAGVGAYRVVVYPVWKINENWAVTGTLQSYSRPYFTESFSSVGHGIEDNILQGTVNYSRVSDKGSVLARVGELSTAFGSFMVHYDDADNALIAMPLEYGYYYKPVTTLGLTGAQVDATRGKWDGRVQFANASPANPRSLFGHDQYGNWAGGAGYTVKQGLRVGVSGYRGPYLSKNYAFYFPGELPPSKLNAHGVGVDVAWATGHWNVQGEWQKFVMPYTVIPDFHTEAAYGEAKRVLSPRWYVAGRAGYTHASFAGYTESYEGVVGWRPNRLQVLKVGYELRHGTAAPVNGSSVVVQLVTSVPLFSWAR